jgi:large subunit ribosomal protein L22
VKVSATAKYLRGSTRKARLVVQVIKGRPVEEAARVLKSAAANAENNLNLPADELVVLDARADEGPTIKRWRPRAQGRAFPIHKPQTHITVTVGNREA